MSKDEVEIDNRGLLQNPKAKGDYLVWPANKFASMPEENLPILAKNRKHARSILRIDCKLAYDSNNETTLYTAVGSFDHEIEKTVCRVRIMTRIR